MARIGIDARLLYYREGGTGVYIRKLIAHLAQLDADNDYAIVHNVRYGSSLIPAANFRRVNALTPCHHRFERSTLALELSRLRLDVWHATDFIPPRGGAKRFVITVHDLNFLMFPQFHTADSLRYYAGQIQAAVEQASLILAVSEATKQDIITHLNTAPDKIIVQGQGVDAAFRLLPSEEVKAVRQRFNLPDGYLLHVGTLEPRKNIPMLFAAYARLRQQLPDAPPLVMVGRRGWLYDDILKAAHQHNIQDNLIWLIDTVDETALPALYNGALAHVLVSHYEGFGMPAAEAMACGTPTIVSNVSSLPEVVGDAGLLVNPDDIEAIAHAMQRVLTDSHLAQTMRERGLEQVKRFTWQQVAQTVYDVYQQALQLPS